MKDRIKVFAPATVANVTCGFDIFGFAINAPGDIITLTKNDSGTIEIKEIIGDGGKLPRNIEENNCSAVIKLFLDDIKSDQGIDIVLNKNMPLGSGLGSSAASAVAAIFAINELMGRPKTREELLPYAMEGERIACGSAHADNVAPSLFGGFILIRSYDPLDTVQVPTPPNLWATVIHPDVEVRTKDAREILRREIYFKESIRQAGNVAGLMAGLLKGDFDLIGRSMHDYIVEPVRSILIPGYDSVKKASKNAGAIGGGISGSGPSLFTFSASEEVAHEIGNAMQQAFLNIDIDSEVYISPINSEGPKIIG